MIQSAPEPISEPDSAYDITRSQAFGPNRRHIQEEIDATLNDLREAYRYSAYTARSALTRAAARLTYLRSRFDR